MIGRVTTVWLVNRNGEYYILKDSWIQDSRVESEIKFIDLLKDDHKLKDRVPKLIEGEDICIGCAVDSTGRYQEHIGGMCDSCGHHRLVTTPIGKQITTFQSKSEFICAIIDIVEGK
jgi:Fungal protein kinase